MRLTADVKSHGRRLNSRRLRVFLCSLNMVFFAIGTPSQGKEPEEILSDAERYTVEVEVTNRVGLHLDEGGDTSGTGFLIDKDRGWIITNAHVATRSPASIEISFKGQPAVSAKRIHIDPIIDLAILQVEDSKIPENAIAASLACADLPRSGAAVLAYGHPMGFKFTGSRGIVSGYTDKYPPSHYLMTDAQIDNGSSGGPLIRVSDGMVVGINTAAVQDENLSVSFAEPAPPVCVVIELLKAGKAANANHLGIGIARSEQSEVLTVGEVYSDQSNLVSGDQLLQINGMGPIKNYADLFSYLRGAEDQAQLLIGRNGVKQTVEVNVFPIPNPLDTKAVTISGLVISEAWRLDDALVNNSHDLMVHFVDYGTQAGHSEAVFGDRVVSVDGQRFNQSVDLFGYLNQLEETDTVQLLLMEQVTADQFHFIYKTVALPARNIRLMELDTL